MLHKENFLFRAAAFAGFSSLAAIAVWSALPATFSRADSSIVQTHPEADAFVTRTAFSVASMSTSASSPRSATKTECGNSWDVSPAVMEEILQQMIRRGWRPPTGAMAVSDVRQIQPDDPNSYVPLRYGQPPVTEDGPIPPTPTDQVSGTVTPPAAPSVIFVPATPAPTPASAGPTGAAALIAEPRPQ